jgi:hypothetical protein
MRNTARRSRRRSRVCPSRISLHNVRRAADELQQALQSAGADQKKELSSAEEVERQAEAEKQRVSSLEHRKQAARNTVASSWEKQQALVMQKTSMFNLVVR